MQTLQNEQILFFEQNVDDQFLVRVFRSMEGINRFIDCLESNLGEKFSNIISSAISSVRIVANRVIREINNEKRKVFSELIHDLRNTITAVMCNVDVVAMFWAQKRYQLACTNIAKLRKAVRLSKDLVLKASGEKVANHFLQKFDDVRQESGAGTIEDVIKIALNLTQSRKIGHQEIICTTLVLTQKYETELLQVFLNLFANAFDAMREKKYDDGESALLKIFACVDENMLRVIVSDNGIGMDEETMSKIFTDQFTTKKSGKGIGLTICKKNIEKIGGEVDVMSSPFKETIFTVKMPV